jgi:hypothetical protein
LLKLYFLCSQVVGVKGSEIGAQPDQLGPNPVPAFLQISFKMFSTIANSPFVCYLCDIGSKIIMLNCYVIGTLILQLLLKMYVILAKCSIPQMNT